MLHLTVKVPMQTESELQRPKLSKHSTPYRRFCKNRAPHSCEYQAKIFWNITPYRLANIYQCFAETSASFFRVEKQQEKWYSDYSQGWW